MTGTTTRAPLPGLDEHERTRHKGDLVYPNLMLSASADHVAAFVLHPLAADRTEVVCALLFARDAVADPGFDPSDAGELWDLVNKQDWAICESVQRGMSSRAYTHGWFAPMEDDSLDIRRWLLPLLEREPMAERVDFVVVGLGGLGSATAWQLARRGHSVLGPGAVRARPRARRQPRLQPDPAPQLPHAGVRPAHAGGVRRLGGPRARVGPGAGDPDRRARPVPAGPGDPVGRLHRRRWTRSASPTTRWTPPR